VHEGAVDPRAMLTELARLLLIIKAERQSRMETLIAALRPSQKSSLFFPLHCQLPAVKVNSKISHVQLG